MLIYDAAFADMMPPCHAITPCRASCLMIYIAVAAPADIRRRATLFAAFAVKSYMLPPSAMPCAVTMMMMFTLLIARIHGFARAPPP